MLGLASAAAACSSTERPGRFRGGAGGGSAGTGFDAGIKDGPPAADAPGLCGQLIVPVELERPNLYFVLDRSGSMSDSDGVSSLAKYDAARQALRQVLGAVGHRMNYGAAIFPIDGSDGCQPGKEVFPTVPGDPVIYAKKGRIGPNLVKLGFTLDAYEPTGGTPTSATLDTLFPIVEALSGETKVVLMTDGAPNCNPQYCGPEDCSLNIEESSFGVSACTPSFNCCDPKLVPNGDYYCVDSSATEAAVKRFADAGIDTFIVGMPGTEHYEALLDQLAVTGGTARATQPYYYATSDSAALGDALRQITVAVTISCTIELGEPPPDRELVNVYLDTELVPRDPIDGWDWISDVSLELKGAACAKLKSADVYEVQVAAGCPTVVR
jgi:hypothetical protein